MPYWTRRPRRPVTPKVGMSPVVVDGRAIARSFWGKAWCSNLESYADYANRLPRGRTYVRAGAVIDLRLDAGVVEAQVAGSRRYTTTVRVAPLPAARWRAIVAAHASGVDSVVSLLEGALPQSLLAALADPASGLFPKPDELKFTCSCPDWASMCKHVAAVLYGIGARLDHSPELFFRLRGVEVADLAAQSHAAALDVGSGLDTLGGADLSALFGITLDDGPPAALPPVAPAAATPRPKKAPATGGKAARATASKAKAKAKARPKAEPPVLERPVPRAPGRPRKVPKKPEPG